MTIAIIVTADLALHGITNHHECLVDTLLQLLRAQGITELDFNAGVELLGRITSEVKYSRF